MSVADIHEQLQEEAADGNLDLLHTVRRIAEATQEAFAQKQMVVSVEGETVFLPHKLATNMAVVVNELITNAIKHGAPGPDGKTQVRIHLEQAEGTLHFSVWNSGNPVASDFDPGQQQNLGLRLVRGLVVEQYGGTFSMLPHEGGARRNRPRAGEAAGSRLRRLRENPEERPKGLKTATSSRPSSHGPGGTSSS